MEFYEKVNRIAKTEKGEIEGIPGNIPQYTVFKGIPYAKAPVGELRWREPQETEKWEGVYHADHFGPIAPQMRHPKGSLYGDEFFQSAEDMSEDCLYLNIWTPEVKEEKKLPVLFWVHGGGLTGGYGFEPEFDGEAFCKEGVILVTFNYRLGVLGFLCHEDLAKESEQGVSGNYGHLDQIAALKWVRKNIGAFGGDPDNITIFGQSAGAFSVQTMLVSPLTRGDIAGSIIMSCADINWPDPGMGQKPMETAEKQGAEFMKDAGCHSIDELRGKSADELMAVMMKGFMKYPMGTVIDHYLLDEAVSDSYYQGNYPDLPMMIGNTAGEWTLVFGVPEDPEVWKEQQRQMMGPAAEKYLELLQVEKKEDIMRAIQESHSWMVKNRVLCELNIRHDHKPCYLYLFDHDLPGNEAGSFHSSELWYVFGTVARCWRPMTGTDYDISRVMTKSWANFAKQKNPNGEGVPEWKPYQPENPQNMVFSEKTECKEIKELEVQRYLKEIMLEHA